jgi:hypothetical protein
MAIPSESFDADLGDVAAKATVAIDECCAGAGAGRGQSGGQTTWATSNDEDVRLQYYIDRAGGFLYLFHTGKRITPYGLESKTAI